MAHESNTTRISFPQEKADFADDERISLSKVDNMYHLEDNDGTEWEFNERYQKWIQVVCSLSHKSRLWAEA